MIKIQNVNSKPLMKKFINFPYQLYKAESNYVPDLRIMQKETLNKKKNPFFKHADAEYLIAVDENGETLGRIAAITNDNYNKHWGENFGFFGFFECIDSQEVAKALFDSAKEWLTEKGVIGIYGPMNPSTNDTCGTLIDGFDTPPYVMMVHNMPYYDKLIANESFVKRMDLFSYVLKVDNFSTKFLKLSDKIEDRLNQHGIKIRKVNFKNIEEETDKLLKIYNKAWGKNWGFVPMERDEFSALVKELKTHLFP